MENIPNLDDLKDTAQVISNGNAQGDNTPPAAPNPNQVREAIEAANKKSDDEDDAVIIDTNAKPIGNGAPDEHYSDKSGISDVTANEIEKRVALMDKQIEREKKFFQAPEGEEGGKIVDPQEVTILFDKTGMGNINFTDDEKKRIETAKKIKLVEVTNKKLETVKIKSKKINDVNRSKYIQKTFNRALSPVMALASGYSAKMRNVSAVESLQIMQRPENDTAKTMLEKWSVIYSKIIDPSCGPFEDFDDFISKTAYLDYNNFIYSILCNSYPEEDSVSFNCNQDGCGKEFTVKFKNKDILRKNDFTEAQKNVVVGLTEAAASGNPEIGKKYMEEHSIVDQLVRFAVDDHSAILVDIYIPSVKEQCENILPFVTADMARPDKQRVTMLAHNIKSIYLPDTDGDVSDIDDIEYVEADNFTDIVYLLSEFNENQLDIIGKEIEKMLAPYMIRFGLDNVKCPFCRHNYGAYPMNLDRLLFQRVQRRLTTEIE